jgi:alcohol dehydrogenase
VVATGPGVTHIAAGDRCAVEPYINCGTCYACRRGFTNCCESNQTLGVMCDGGMTERMLLPARKLHRSSSLTFDQLALVETLGIGCHAINRGAPQPGNVVLVVGAGPIGLSVMEFARLSGARTVAMDMNEQRLAFVRERMHIPDTILVTGDGSELTRLGELTGGQLADVVVDATGSNLSMARSITYCAFKGRLVYVGITQSDIIMPHAPALHRRELDILASRNALPGDFTRIIALIESGQIDTRPWITHSARFADVIGLFDGWTKPQTGVIKAIVTID